MESTKLINVTKWIARAIWVAFVIAAVAICVGVSQKNKTIKRLKQERQTQTEMIMRETARADSLAKLERITVNSTIVVNQKGIVNTTQANLISKTVATYTRDEVLNAIDSLNKAKTHR